MIANQIGMLCNKSFHHFDLIVYDLREKIGIQSIACLEEFLQVASTRSQGKILFLSGADVLEKKRIPAIETTFVQTESKEGKLLSRLEALALSWKQQGLHITILRFPDIYGTGMERKDNFISQYLYACAENKSVPLYRSDEKRDFLSSQDVAYAIFQTYERGYIGDYLHFASGKPLTYDDFYHIVWENMDKEPKIDSHKQGHFAQAILDPEQARKQIGWKARHSLAENIADVYRDVTHTLLFEEKRRQKERQEQRDKKIKERIMPYAENVIGALLMLWLMQIQGGSSVNPIVPFDFNFLYIAVMGLLYGRRQAFLAVFFSYLILLVLSFGNLGFGLIAVMYQPAELLHFLSYLAMGVITGYISEQSKFRDDENRWQHLHDQERYRFLCHMFKANVNIKDKMYRQIVNSQDSIGRIYRIVSTLDSVEPENIYNKTALVTAEVLDVSQIIIYSVGRDSAYLRQKVRIGDMTEGEPHSLRIDDYPYLQQMMKEHNLFINRDLIKGLPDLAAPIIYEGRVIAVIQVYQMDFDKWSTFELNLMAVTSRLVSTSLARAYTWEQEMMERRYIPGTRILKEKEFVHIIEELRERHQMQKGYSVTIARIDLPGMTYKQIDQRLGNQIRLEDYMGILGDSVWIMFTDVNKQTLALIQKRLAQGGVLISEAKEVI